MATTTRSKPKKATVNVTRDDVAYMRHSHLDLTPPGVKSGAKARASARELFLDCRSTTKALTALTAGLPRPKVEEFCREFLKKH